MRLGEESRLGAQVGEEFKLGRGEGGRGGRKGGMIVITVGFGGERRFLDGWNGRGGKKL